MATLLHFKVRKTAYLMRIRPGFTLLWSAIFILMLGLSDWQLHRYHFKQTLLNNYTHSEAKPTHTLVKDDSVANFQKIRVQGTYLPKLSFMVSRRLNDQAGHEIYTALKMQNDDKLILIDRGWLRETAQQDLAPKTLKVVISGRIKFQNEYQFILGKNIQDANRQPLYMQKLDLAELSQLTHQAFYPYALRVSESSNDTSEDGWIRDWPAPTFGAERHLGYAVQWLVMASVLLIAYFCFVCERVKNVNEKT